MTKFIVAMIAALCFCAGAWAGEPATNGAVVRPQQLAEDARKKIEEELKKNEDLLNKGM